MWKLRPLFSVFFFFLLCSSAGFVAAQRSASLWQTLGGDDPIVIARGGFSGLFPESSFNAYAFALTVSLPNLVSWCNVQLTKDGAGICFPDLRLDNASDVTLVYKNRVSTYLVNGVPIQGQFTVDFTLKDLQLLTLSQGIFSRPYNFDGVQAILTVDSFASQIKPPAIWLNAENDAFFSQHNLSMRNFVISVSRRVVVNYISSSEVNFLKSIASRFRPPTKLIFRFLGPDDIEPSTNQSYGSLLKNLTFIKTFASGILVPKYYILPVGSDLYLQSPTTVVSDAHKEGLEIYASEFASDVPFAYDYNYDPVSEYLSYIDNGNFSVDGVLSDFPLTPSAAIDCFSHMGKNETEKAKFLIISSEGSSGQYPGCTDMAYNQAIADGADIIDCPVQMSQDGVPFCMGSINLIDRTTIAQTSFTNLAMNIPELHIQGGILPFNLTWSQIQTLKPSMYNPYAAKYSLFRNPKFRSAGNFVQLSQFLDIAKNASSLSGVLISIENAAFLAQSAGLGVVDAVVDALNKSGYSSLTGKKVFIESSDSAVLTKIGKTSNYELVYEVDETISDITSSTVSEIKKFSTAVVIRKGSVFPLEDAFLANATKVVQKFQALGMPVYVQLFNNEFVSQAYDFLSDATLEVNTHTSELGVEGVVTAFPATSSRLRKNRCLGKDAPTYMLPAQPGDLLAILSIQPPVGAPFPVLNESAVVEPPLPPVGVRPLPPATRTGDNETTTTRGPTPPNGQCTIVANTVLSSLAMFLYAYGIVMS